MGVRADCRQRMKEYEQILRASASQLKNELQRLKNSYWIKKAEDFEQQAEILLSKARTARLKHEELVKDEESIKKEIESKLLQAGVAKACLRLTGKASQILLMENPRSTVEFYIHMMMEDEDSADKVLERDISGRTSNFLKN